MTLREMVRNSYMGTRLNVRNSRGGTFLLTVQVGKTRGVALDHAVLTLGPPANDHVDALGIDLKHGRNVGGIVLQVRIQGHDHVAGGIAKAGGKGGGLPAVPGKGQEADTSKKSNWYYQSRRCNGNTFVG